MEATSKKSWGKIVGYTICILLFFMPLFIRIGFITELLNRHIQLPFWGGIQVIIHDSIIYFAMGLLLYLSFLSFKRKIPVLILRFLAFCIFFIYLADVMVLLNFNSHITIVDFLKYTEYASQYIQQIYKQLIWVILGLIVLLIGFIWLLTRPITIQKRSTHRIFQVGLVGMLLPYLFRTDDVYIHAWLYKNIIEYNQSIVSETADYTDEFIDNFEYEDEMSCASAEAQQPNIVLLMVESLSSYQSDLFSGIYDWTPNIDAIAQENGYFTNFYANGFTTEDAEVAMLTGEYPIQAPSTNSNPGYIYFQGFFHLEESLPKLLNDQGYQTDFLTTSDLIFANTIGWTKNLQFDYIEGHEHPEYDNWPRYQFLAAPDEALYGRVQERIEQQSSPYFLFAKTVSTHHPFINPDTDEVSEEETFRYADKHLGRFYEQLQQTDFFDNGILLIMGDHHTMMPLRAEEIEKYGSYRAPAKVPLIVVQNNQQFAEDGLFQQTDIYHSIKGLVEGKNCTSDWVGNVLTEQPIPAQYAVHRRGDRRDLVSIFGNEVDSFVKLDGDDTQIYQPDEGVTAEEITAFIDRINNARIRRVHNLNPK